MARKRRTVPSAPSGVLVSLVAPDVVKVGTRVRFGLHVRNAGDQAVDLYLRGREPTMEVVVSDEHGRTLWRRLEGQIIPAVLQLHALAPGGELEVSAEWDLRVHGRPIPPGRCVLHASLLTESQPLAAPVRSMDVTV